MLVDLAEIILAYFQFIVLIVKTDTSIWPIQWRGAGSIMSVVNLDSAFFETYFAFLNPDFRIYYLFVGVLIPLAIILLGLLAMNTKKVVLWYAMLLTGLLCLVVGILATIVGAASAGGVTVASDLALILMIAGGCAVLACVLAFVINKKCTKDETEEVKSVKELKEEETAHLQKWTLLQQLILFLCLVTLAVMLMFFNFESGFAVFDSLGFIIAIICFSFAGLTLIFMLMGLCVQGRRALWALSHFAVQNAMKLLLSLLSILYVAIASSTISVFNCNEYGCSQGERLPDQGSLIPIGFSNATSQTYCDPCAIPSTGQLCPVALRDSICSPNPEERLQQDKTVKCAEMRAFFWPSAGIVAFFFVFGTPVMFFTLVRKSTQILLDDFPLKTPTDDEEENWELKVHSTKNVAKFLFQSYKYKFRFGRVFQTVHKILIVSQGAYILRFGADSPIFVALLAALIVHALAMLLLFIARPFLRLIEGFTANTLMIFVVVLAAIGLALVEGAQVEGADLIATILLVLYIVAPILFLVIGVLMEVMSAAEDAEALEDDKKTKMEVVVEIMTTDKEITATKQKIQDIRIDMAAEVTAQEKLGKSITAAAKDNLRKSRDRQEQLALLLEENETALGQLEAYKIDLTTEMEEQAGSLRGDGSPRKNKSGAGASFGRGASSSQLEGHPLDESSSQVDVANEGSMGSPSPRNNRPNVRPSSSAGRGAGTPKSTTSAWSRSNRPPTLASLQGSQREDKKAESPTIPLSPPGAQRGSFRGSGVFSPGKNMGTRPGSAAGKNMGARPGSAAGPGAGRPGTSSGSSSPRKSQSGQPDTQAASGSMSRNPRNPLAGSTGAGLPPRAPSNLSPSKTAATVTPPKQPSLGDAGAGGGFAMPSTASHQEEEAVGTPPTSDDEATASSDASDFDLEEDEPAEQQAAAGLGAGMSGDGNENSSRSNQSSKAVPASSAIDIPTEPATAAPADTNEASVASFGIGESSGPSHAQEKFEEFDDADDDDNSYSSGALKTEGSTSMGLRGGGMSLSASQHFSSSLSPRGGGARDNNVLMAAAKAVTEIMKDEDAERADAQDTVDHNINTQLQGMLNRYFMVGGIAGFVALAFALLGLLTATDADGHATQSNYLSKTTSNHFAGYNNWTSMTEQCCCLPFTFDSPSSVASIEKWVCASGRVMERVRGTRSHDGNGNEVAVVTGYEIRALCSVSFTTSSCEAYADSTGTVTLDCTNTTITNSERELW